MSIQLFSHNQIAYNSALDMLELCGKAAIIHPAGTGKYFIGFKLCEEKSEAKICWLSPSEYIFRTQIENFKKAGGTEPKNICFYTYAKLMLMIDGIILFRSTVSPIIYKQQIGRALSASKDKEPIIFDIVNNIDNLYSIGAIEQEMQIAMNYYRFLGIDEEIVNEHFKIVYKVQNVRQVFDKLNDTLTASWDMMYAYTKQYYTEYGNLEVPRRYKTEGGYSLGHWIFTQRSVYKGETFGTLGK